MAKITPVVSNQETLTVSSTAVAIASPPAACNYAEGYVRTAAVVELRDGTTPTATKGRQWNAGDIIVLRSKEEVDGFLAIRQGATDATIDWEFFSRS